MDEPAFQDVVARISRGLITGDFGLYRSAMDLPLHVEPIKGKPYVLSTESDLREDFDLYVISVRANHVDNIWRDVLRITPGPGDSYRVWFTTQIFAGAVPVVDPFPSMMQFHLAEDGWRVRRIASSIGHINWTRGLARITPDRKFSDN